MATQQLATIADLENFGLPANALPGTVTTDQKNAALGAASSIVAGYLRKRFALPLLQWGIDLRVSTVMIAVYLLMGKRGFNPSTGLDSLIVSNYKDQVGEPGKLGWLDRVARGEVEPDDLIDSTETADEASPLLETSELPPHRAIPLFTRDDEC